MAAQLREKIEKATRERDELLSALAESEDSVSTLRKAANDVTTAKEALQRDKEALEADKAELEKRREVVKDFPTETQILKLERRLESAKTQLAEAEKSVGQARTGIEAYNMRCESCRVARTDLSGSLSDAVQTISADVDTQAAEEDKVKEAAQIIAYIDELISICEEREGQLVELNQAYAEKAEEEATLNERIVKAQRSVDEEVPRLEAEADRCISEITEAWSVEKAVLQAAYEKLYAVNKEQQFHLARGTHVKMESTPDTTRREDTLSARHARLSAELNEARERLTELKSDNLYTKKINEQLRQEGRKSVSAYDERIEEVTKRLEEAKGERVDAEAEARKLRNLKGDLQQALNTIREK